jgi:hypothetical protein
LLAESNGLCRQTVRLVLQRDAVPHSSNEAKHSVLAAFLAS